MPRTVLADRLGGTIGASTTDAYVCWEEDISNAWNPQVTGPMVKGPTVFDFAQTVALWFWSDEWQMIEAEADEELASGSLPQGVGLARLKEHLDMLKGEGGES